MLDAGDSFYACGLDDDGLPMVQTLVIAKVADKTYKLTESVRINGFGSAFYLAANKCKLKRVVPSKAVGFDYVRGNFFHTKSDAITRLERYVNQQRDKIEKATSVLASQIVRLDMIRSK